MLCFSTLSGVFASPQSLLRPAADDDAAGRTCNATFQMLPHWDSCQTNSNAASLASNAAQGSHIPAVLHAL